MVAPSPKQRDLKKKHKKHKRHKRNKQQQLTAILILKSSVSISTSSKNFIATLFNASSGQPKNRSAVVQLTRPGKRRARTRNVSPTGLKHNTTCNKERTRSIKNFNK